jgi:hypothetical protein
MGQIVKIVLDQNELNALFKLCVAELRTPSDQARFLVRGELERRGLLESSSQRPPDSDIPDSATESEDRCHYKPLSPEHGDELLHKERGIHDHEQ